MKEEKPAFQDWKNSVKARKIRRQVRAAHAHKNSFLKIASQSIALPKHAYLDTDDRGEIVIRFMIPGQCESREEREVH